MPDHFMFLLAAETAGGEYSVPTAFGIEPTGYVALAMIAVLLLMTWKKVPAAIGKALDAKIAVIRDQLEEAEALRKEAEALKAEYEAKAKSAEKEATAIIERAEADAVKIVDKAKDDTQALLERRRKMAEAKIAAEELAAVAEIKALAANAAVAAAARIIAEKHDAEADQKQVDQAIAKLD